jgi:hypothetical protein
MYLELGEDEFIDDDKSVDYDYPDGADMDYEGDQPQVVDFNYFDSIGN